MQWRSVKRQQVALALKRDPLDALAIAEDHFSAADRRIHGPVAHHAKPQQQLVVFDQLGVLQTFDMRFQMLHAAAQLGQRQHQLFPGGLCICPGLRLADGGRYPHALLVAVFLRESLDRVAQQAPQLVAGLACPFDQRAQRGRVALGFVDITGRRRRAFKIVRQLGEQAADEPRAAHGPQVVEELQQRQMVEPPAELVGGDVFEVVRFVDHQMVVGRQHLAVGLDVAEQQRVVDDHQMRGLGLAARPEKVAALELGATRAGAGVEGHVELGPDPCFVLVHRQLGVVAGFGLLEPQLDLEQRLGLLGRCSPSLRSRP